MEKIKPLAGVFHATDMLTGAMPLPRRPRIEDDDFESIFREEMSRGWEVIPDDPDMEARAFDDYYSAQDWADGLCCSYDIQRL